MNQNLLKENENSQYYQQEALRQAQQKALNAKNHEQEFSRQLQETRIALEKEISKQLIEQLTIRAQKQSVTPEQQALIEKLYLDLRLINAELAFGILKSFSNVQPQQQQVVQAPPPQQQQQQRNVQESAQLPPPPQPRQAAVRQQYTQQQLQKLQQIQHLQQMQHQLQHQQQQKLAQPQVSDEFKAAKIRSSRR